MRRRLLFATVMVTLMAVGLTVPVAAGGWAVTRFNNMPTEFEADTTYSLEYTILQHGQHPASVDGTYIRIWSPKTGEEFTFPGSATGSEGTYAAEVTFPTAGVWEWEVQPGWFAAHSLGSVTIAADGAAGSANGRSSLTHVALPIAALGLALLTAMQGYWLLRDRRQQATVSAPAGAGD